MELSAEWMNPHVQHEAERKAGEEERKLYRRRQHDGGVPPGAGYRGKGMPKPTPLVAADRKIGNLVQF